MPSVEITCAPSGTASDACVPTATFAAGIYLVDRSTLTLTLLVDIGTFNGNGPLTVDGRGNVYTTVPPSFSTFFPCVLKQYDAAAVAAAITGSPVTTGTDMIPASAYAWNISALAAREEGGSQILLIDQFLKNAIEVDADLVCDGKQAVIGGVMQHVEEAGVHSGDSTSVLPPHSLDAEVVAQIETNARKLALELGSARQREFLARLGLTEPIRSEAGPIAAPKLPAHWGQAETITISYGHGMAVAPIQFAAAAATLINGGLRVTPTFRRPEANPANSAERILSTETSAAIREIMRRNVVSPHGTGRRAEVPGYEVGGKTGTAEMPGRGGYREKSVIASFLAAFPMSDPKYVVLTMLYEPKPTDKTGGRITAGINAAPVAGQIIARTAPLLGVLPH